MENIKEKEEKRKYYSFYRHVVRSIFPKHLKFYFETLNIHKFSGIFISY